MRMLFRPFSLRSFCHYKRLHICCNWSKSRSIMSDIRSRGSQDKASFGKLDLPTVASSTEQGGGANILTTDFANATTITVTTTAHDATITAGSITATTEGATTDDATTTTTTTTTDAPTSDIAAVQGQGGGKANVRALLELGFGSDADYIDLGLQLTKYRFSNGGLLRQALTHGSWKENQSDSSKFEPHYERLEFLGDAVLKLIHASMLFKLHPDWAEGRLTCAKQIFEQNSNFSRWAVKMGLAKYTRYGASIGKDSIGRNKMYANVFESVVGAIYLDCNGNFNTTYDIYMSWNLWPHGLESGVDGGSKRSSNNSSAEHDDDIIVGDGDGGDPYDIAEENPRAAVQEFLQKRGLPLPVYSDVSKGGTDHAPIFTRKCTALVDLNSGEEVDKDKFVSVLADGPTKKSADKAAAVSMYNVLMAMKLRR